VCVSGQGIWGDRWGSNPRQPESQSGALPTELRSPLNSFVTLRVGAMRMPPLQGVVGVERFELPTSCSQSRRATRLRYTPNFCSVCRVGMILTALRPVNLQSKEKLSESTVHDMHAHGDSSTFDAPVTAVCTIFNDHFHRRKPVANLVGKSPVSVRSRLSALRDKIIDQCGIHRVAALALQEGIR
jgi:hypothetical protein